MSIRKRLPMMLIAMVSIPLLILSLVIYNYTSISITNTGKKNIEKITAVEGNALNTFLNSQIREVQLSARRDIFAKLLSDAENSSDIIAFAKEPDAVKVDSALYSRVHELGNIQHSYLCNLSGSIIADSNSKEINLDISSRDYFKKAIAGEMVVSDEMISLIDGDNIIVIASPVLDEKGKISGLYCNAIRISAFDKFLKNIKIGDTGYAYLVDHNGTIISHPVKEKLGKQVNNAAIQKVIDSGFSSDKFDTIVDTYTYDQKQKYVGITVLPKLKWVLAVTQNIDEINKPAKLEFIFILITTIIMIIVAIICSLFLTRSIINPITKLTETMKKAENGDLDVKCEYQSYDEFVQLSDKFNNMIKKLSSSYEELSSVYEELSATEEELRSQYEELLDNQKALVQSEERFKQVIDGINDAVWEWDVEKNVFFTSDKWESITGNSCKNIGIKDFLKNLNLENYFNNMKEKSANIDGYYRNELQITTKDGDKKWILVRGKLIKDSDGKIIKIAGSISDYTEIKNANDRIRELAYYDTLTGIPNRNTFLMKVDDIINQYIKYNKLGAIFFIDLDDFKRINDSLGHDIGDKLLRAISVRISNILSENETLCRFGGDEFLLLKENVHDQVQMVQFAKKLLNLFESNFLLDGKQVFITCSVGICVFPISGKDKNTILKNADTAMYKAKEKGKNTYEFYNEEMSEQIIRKMQVEKAIRIGLVSSQFYLNYQPQVNLKSGKIVGVESLVRLKNDELGFLSPAEFIPISEENGLIVPIGDWVMETACIKNNEWIANGYADICVAINVSSVQIHQNDFMEKIKALVKKTGIPTNRIEIEITESVLMEDLKENVNILQELKNMGIRTALDDFGTGYSSLNYLRMIPIDTLKIDKSFIDDICVNDKQGAIVDGIIGMAHKLGMQVVAEGIETYEQLEVLKQKDCDIIQGYIFSKPLSDNDIEKMLRQGKFDIEKM